MHTYNFIRLGPFAGHHTDITTWAACRVKLVLEQEMVNRLAAGKARLKRNTDKLFFYNALLTPAFSRRHGNFVLAWMQAQNTIMSKLRIGIEWSFGKIIGLWKYHDFYKTQKLRGNYMKRNYFCHTCVNGGQLNTAFDIFPHSIEKHLA